MNKEGSFQPFFYPDGMELSDCLGKIYDRNVILTCHSHPKKMIQVQKVIAWRVKNVPTYCINQKYVSWKDTCRLMPSVEEHYTDYLRNLCNTCKNRCSASLKSTQASLLDNQCTAQPYIQDVIMVIIMYDCLQGRYLKYYSLNML